MAATTTIRLPPKLRARLGALAKQTGRSAHSLIVEAVERHADYEEQMRSLVKEALAADADIEKTGEVLDAPRLREIAPTNPIPANTIAKQTITVKHRRIRRGVQSSRESSTKSSDGPFHGIWRRENA